MYWRKVDGIDADGRRDALAELHLREIDLEQADGAGDPLDRCDLRGGEALGRRGHQEVGVDPVTQRRDRRDRRGAVGFDATGGLFAVVSGPAEPASVSVPCVVVLPRLSGKVRSDGGLVVMRW